MHKYGIMTFLDNKYTKWYSSIIDRARARILIGYSEKHHVIPRSLGGTNDDENLVRLTAREHFICHMMLARMTVGKAKKSMINAAFNMSHLKAAYHQRNYKVNSHLYETLRKQYADSRRGPRSEETKRKMSEAAKKRKRGPLSDAHKEAIRQGHLGIKVSDEGRAAIAAGCRKKFENPAEREKISAGLRGKTLSEETKLKISESVKITKQRQSLDFTNDGK